MLANRASLVALILAFFVQVESVARAEAQHSANQPICSRFASAYSTPAPGTKPAFVSLAVQLSDGEPIPISGSLGIMTKVIYPDLVTALGILPSKVDGDSVWFELFGITASPTRQETTVVRLGDVLIPKGVQATPFGAGKFTIQVDDITAGLDDEDATSDTCKLARTATIAAAR